MSLNAHGEGQFRAITSCAILLWVTAVVDAVGVQERIQRLGRVGAP